VLLSVWLCAAAAAKAVLLTVCQVYTQYNTDSPVQVLGIIILPSRPWLTSHGPYQSCKLNDRIISRQSKFLGSPLGLSSVLFTVLNYCFELKEFDLFIYLLLTILTLHYVHVCELNKK